MRTCSIFEMYCSLPTRQDIHPPLVCSLTGSGQPAGIGSQLSSAASSEGPAFTPEPAANVDVPGTSVM